MSASDHVGTSENLRPGNLVRLIGDPSRMGQVDRLTTRGGREYCVIRFFPDALQEVPRSQIEPLPPKIQGPVELLAEGRFSHPDRLRQVLAHVRLTGRLADIIYSMEATNTHFYPYQFKPVLTGC